MCPVICCGGEKSKGQEKIPGIANIGEIDDVN